MPHPIFLVMQRFFVTGFVLLIAVTAVLVYVARPFETPEQYAQRLCRESPPTGISYERCVDGRRLERLSGRPEVAP